MTNILGQIRSLQDGGGQPVSLPSIPVIVVILILVAATVLHMQYGFIGTPLSCHAIGFDDAYISYRYAENLASGHGLVFNPGERVEGYSNFLYVVLIALLTRLTGAQPYALSGVLNVGFLALALWLFFSWCREELGGGWASLGALLFALTPSFWLWGASGMETALVLLTQIALWVATERVVQRSGNMPLMLLCTAILVSVLLRADGFLLPGVAVLYLLLSRKWKATFISGLVLFVATVSYFAWRYSYYGDFLPNTYYAKVSGPLLLRFEAATIQLAIIVLASGLGVYIVAMAIAAGRGVVRGLRGLGRPDFGSVLAAVILLYWFYIGGDHLGERFLLLLAPLGIFTISRVAAAGRLARRPLATAVLILLALQLHPVVTDSRFRYQQSKYDLWLELGEFLGQQHPGETLAIGAVGKVPFASGLYTIDMLGLTDATLARRQADEFTVPGHNKFDPAYVLSRRPDLIATWAQPDMDLFYGLTREKTSAAGYRIRYLASSGRYSREANILDVTGMSGEQLRELWKKNYRYAVLERVET